MAGSYSKDDGARKILISVDAEPHSKAAFNWFLNNILRKDDKVILTHIPEPPALPTLSLNQANLNVPYDEWKKVLEESIKKVEKMKADYETDLISKRVNFKMTGEPAKNVGEAIIAEAEKENVSMIIMGTRGLGTIKRALLGSVSDFVAHNSLRPVLIIPFNKKE